MDHEAGRAEQQQERRRRGFLPVLGNPITRRPIDQPERAEHEGAACEARGRMELEDELEQAAERDRHPVIQRRIVQPEPAAHARHDEFAALRHVVHDARPIASCDFHRSWPASPGRANASAITTSAAGGSGSRSGGKARRGIMNPPENLLGLLFRRFLGVAALKLLDPARGVDDLLLAG